MRLIPLREAGGVKTAEIIKAVMERPTGQGFDVAALRARCRVLDALERNADRQALLLEDADHATLVAALKQFQFGMATTDLLRMVDDVLDAKEPPAAETAV